MFTVERLAEHLGFRIFVLMGLRRRRWEHAEGGPPVVFLPWGLTEDERTDQIGSAICEWAASAYGWPSVERWIDLSRAEGSLTFPAPDD
jgi:hypothetical protein